jgi:polyferredoxin
VAASEKYDKIGYHKLIKRRIVQAAALLLLHSSWGPELKWLCNPVLSCHSCVLSWFACPIGVFIHYSGYHLFPFFALGTVLLLGILFGRLFCGWVCPFGFLQDMLHKIPTRKVTLPHWTSRTKYFVLAAGVFILPFFLGEETVFSFCRICPASALQVTIPNLITRGLRTVSVMTLIKLSVLAVMLLGIVLSSRAFCKVLCPIGALLAPLNTISLHFVKIPAAGCVSCQKCDDACPTDISPSRRIELEVSPSRDLDCVVCHDCRKSCVQATDSPDS